LAGKAKIHGAPRWGYRKLRPFGQRPGNLASIVEIWIWACQSISYPWSQQIENLPQEMGAGFKGASSGFGVEYASGAPAWMS
jgi:hypothetical protein